MLISPIFRPTKRLRQPPGLVGIKRSSPFAAGLLWACIPGDISICSDPKSPTISGGYTLAVGLAGRGAKGPATQVAGKVSYAASINIAASQDYAFATFAIPSTDTTVGTSGIIELVGSNTNYLAAASNGARAQVDNNTTALNTWTRKEPNLFLASRKGGTAYCYTPAGVITVATGTRSQVITEISVGRASGNNLSNPHHFLVLVWGRHISALEYAALAANPWQVLTEDSGIFPVGVSSSGTSVDALPGHALLTCYQPAVIQTDHHTVGASPGHLAATGYQPTVSQSSGNVVNPAAGHALLTGYQPTVTRTANQTIAAATGHLVASGKQPTVVQTSPGTIFPLTGHAVLTGYQPIIIRTDNPAAVVDSAGARFAMSPAPIRIPVVDSAGMMTQAWKKWATSIYNRVGGPIAATNNELSESLPEDAGIEELKALLFSLADSSGQAAQSAAPIPPDDWMLAPTSSVQSLDTEIETRMAAMAEEIALLRTQINDMQQGLTL